MYGCIGDPKTALDRAVQRSKHDLCSAAHALMAIATHISCNLS
jgi:hypothetical protein